MCIRVCSSDIVVRHHGNNTETAGRKPDKETLVKLVLILVILLNTTSQFQKGKFAI